MAYHAHFDDLDIYARSNWRGRGGEIFNVELARQQSKQYASSVKFCFHVTLALKTFIWLDYLGFVVVVITRSLFDERMGCSVCDCSTYTDKCFILDPGHIKLCCRPLVFFAFTDDTHVCINRC